MFGLEMGKALIDDTHPKGKEYVWPLGCGPIFYPLDGKDAVTIVKISIKFSRP